MFYEKILLLNETIVDCLNETDENKIIRAFTELGINVLDASFGFVWLNSKDSSELKLFYKSPNLPYTPQPPRKEGRNYAVIRSRTPDYVSQVKKRADIYDVSKYMNSFVIIPISHGEKVYGNMVLCFKKPEAFHKEKKVLCSFIGNAVGDAITIHRLMQSEKERSKIEFITEATHELRTPLAIIKGNVDLALLSKEKKPREVAKTLRIVNEEVRNMSTLVSDLSLLITSGDSFRRKIASHKVRLDTIILRVAKRCESIAPEKKISIKAITLPKSTISGDEAYLETLFTNLVRNAVMYGKRNGKIIIKGSKKKGTIEVQVIDNGLGISKKDLPHIFDRFYRGTREFTKNQDGSGLGLAIVKWIVEAHGGTIAVTSKEGSGATFRLSFPVSL